MACNGFCLAMVAVPFCRCRVLYIGSAVPTITKDGLQGIQQPLRERYPIDDSADTKGIDSWFVIILLKNDK
ncbi:unnamed protein product [Gongylonema pulchrum]|uniref:Secreted protein n=1 Tax=Gongylonema pulchrum TaxID=637853 RepID=A0A183CYW7_9BILA|nr:unnamed protein product [Gongylonema pulchrum]